MKTVDAKGQLCPTPLILTKRALNETAKGMNYIVIRKNKRTHWYVFFKTTQKDGETIYKVRYIANNHTIAQYL